MEQKKIMKQRASHEQKYEDPGHAALHVLMCTGTWDLCKWGLPISCMHQKTLKTLGHVLNKPANVWGLGFCFGSNSSSNQGRTYKVNLLITFTPHALVCIMESLQGAQTRGFFTDETKLEDVGPPWWVPASNGRLQYHTWALPQWSILIDIANFGPWNYRSPPIALHWLLL